MSGAQDAAAITSELKATVPPGKRDDCVRLRSAELAGGDPRFSGGGGAVIERPAPAEAESSEKQSEWQARVEELVARLAADVRWTLTNVAQSSRARWTLRNTGLAPARGEDAVVGVLSAVGFSSEDLFDERAALSVSTFAARRG